MKKTTYALFTFIIILFSSFSSYAQDDKTQRIQASYILSFGQLPQQGEITHWLSQPQSSSMALLMAAHKAFIGTGGYKKEAIINSYKDGWGIKMDENDSQYKFWAQYSQTYTELMTAHIQYFIANPAVYEKVIKRAFQFSMGRQPSAAELNTWKNAANKYSYAILTGFLQTIANTVSLSYRSENRMILNSLSTAVTGIRVSSKIAGEIKSISGLITNDGGTLVAAGAGNLITNDGGTLVAAGAGNIALNSGAN